MTLATRQSYEFGPFRLDLAEQRLLRDGQRIALRPKVFEVLRVLVENSGRLVEKDRLLKEVWPDSFVEEGNINRSISVLRKTLGEHPADQKYIETVPTRGYRFVAVVTQSSHHETHAPGEAVASGSPANTTSRATLLFAVALVSMAVLSYVGWGRATWEAPAGRTVAPVHSQLTFTGQEGSPTLSPDGSRIAYVSSTPADQTVIVQERSGGRPLAVLNAPETGRLRWAPDGSELLLWTRGAGKNGLFVMSQLGGVPRSIAAGQFVGCWSPDGATIAVARYLDKRISFVDRRGAERRSITLEGDHRWILDMDWSAANGRLLVVSDDEQGRSTIWTMRPDGSEQTRVRMESTEIPSARWTPRGDAIYFSRRVNGTISLFKIPALAAEGQRAGSAAALVTGLESDGSFGLSADGKQLVYARAPFHSNLWMVEAGRSSKGAMPEPRALTQGTSYIERPRVSPDGKSIVFTAGHESLADLYTMPATGGARTQLTFLDSFSVGGAWSPDGQWLAFGSTRGGATRVWMLNGQGGPPFALSSGAMSNTFEIAWSPDSQMLYQERGNRNFRVLDPQTRREHPLVKDSSVGWMFSPVFSRDGKRIAVAWNRRPAPGIWTIGRQDATETLVYKAFPPPHPIGWSADGSFIYALDGKRPSYRGRAAHVGETLTESRILRVPLNGGPPETLLVLPFEEVGGVAMAPDGRRFVCTVYSSRSDVWIVGGFD